MKLSTPNHPSEWPSRQSLLHDIRVEPLTTGEEVQLAGELLDAHHYLGAPNPVGERLWYAVIDADGYWLGVLLFAAESHHLPIPHINHKNQFPNNMKYTMTNLIRRLGTALLAATALAATAAEPVDMNKRAEELKNLKWGMFICWSFSTFSGKEWTPGITDISFFRATGVDTDQWARTAKEAGMGYILFLTKHHDGFCLWDTKTTDRKVTNAPLGRDVLAELKKSCDKYGIKLALYFSEGEWRHPGGLDDPATPGAKRPNQGGRDPEMKKAQLKELLTQYGPIEYIWFDHAVGDGGLSHADTVAFCKALQPGCFVGFNHGAQEGSDIRLGEMGKPGPLTDNSGAGYNKGVPSKDYLLAEFTYPILPAHDGGAMWFYSLPKHDGLCKPAESLYLDYLGAVKYGNVFALDVGPNYEGKLRDIDVATLRRIGAWIRDPSEAPKPPPAALSTGKPTTASSN
jgi:alpha-L-fucosidase